MFAIFIFEVYFSEAYLMARAENSISEPPNLNIFCGRIPPDPPTRLVSSALAIVAPVTKNLATALGNAKKILCHFEIPFKSMERKGDLIDTLSSFIQEYTCFSPSAL